MKAPRADYRDFWKRFAGRAIDTMLGSPEATQQFLTDRDPNMRIAALSVMTDYWGPTPEFANRCEELALTDPDPQVQRFAVLFLGSVYQRTHDDRIERLLATLVRDDSRPLAYRENAYNALFSVADCPYALWPAYRSLEGRAFRFPDDVNWEFVDSILAEVRPSWDPVTARVEWVSEQFPSVPVDITKGIARYTLGMEAFKAGAYELAVDHFTASIKEHAVASCYEMRARSLGKLGKLEGAIADATTAIEHRPDYAELYRLRADLLRELGRIHLADADDRMYRSLEEENCA